MALQGLQQMGCWYPCNCCKIFSDNFDDASIDADWTSVAGSWSESSGVLSAGTSAILTRSMGTGSSIMHLVVGVKGNTNDLLRVIFGYVDTSNYWFAEVKIGNSGTLRIYERASGSDTLRATTGISVAGGIGSFTPLTVCLDQNGQVSAAIASGSVNFATGLTTNDLIGLGTGATAAAAEFDDLVVRKVSSSCEQCERPCNICVAYSSPTPWAWDVTFPAMTNGACTQCATLIGGQTFRLLFCGTGAGGCVAGYSFGACGGVELDFSLHFHASGSNVNMYAQILARATSTPCLFPGLSGTIIFSDIFSTPFDCATTRVLPHAGSSTTYCNLTSPGSATATAVPVY